MAKENNQITHISAGTIITGELVAENDIHIAGCVKGKVESSGHLSVENSGKLEAEVRVRSATISGSISGNIVVQERIELSAQASITGDLQTRELVIHEGAVFQGNCAMNNQDSASKES